MAISSFAHFCKLSYTVLEQVLKKLRVILVSNNVLGFKCGFARLSSADNTSLPGLIVLGSNSEGDKSFISNNEASALTNRFLSVPD